MGTKIRCIVLTDVENCWADSGVNVWPEELGLLISSSTHPIPQKSVIISHLRG